MGWNMSSSARHKTWDQPPISPSLGSGPGPPPSSTRAATQCLSSSAPPNPEEQRPKTWVMRILWETTHFGSLKHSSVSPSVCGIKLSDGKNDWKCNFCEILGLFRRSRRKAILGTTQKLFGFWNIFATYHRIHIRGDHVQSNVEIRFQHSKVWNQVTLCYLPLHTCSTSSNYQRSMDTPLKLCHMPFGLGALESHADTAFRKSGTWKDEYRALCTVLMKAYH